MPNYSRRRPNSRSANAPAPDTSTDSATAVSNAAAVETLEAANATSEEKEQVVVYLTQNSVTHHKDEIPETLASMKDAEQLGYGRKSMIPISDPFADGHKTDQYAFGESKAAEMTWWHDDKSLKVGQVKVGGSTLTLGATEDREQSSQELATISTDWMTALLHVGLTRDKATEVVAALIMDDQGKPQLTHSGAGASNELMQLISVLNRAEMGEFEISSLILSGHHYEGDSFLFGEVPGGDHEYDDNEVTGDTLDVRDIEALSTVFPKAFKQIDSVMFSACNTHDLGLVDENEESVETKDWIEKVFPDAQKMGLWQNIAPGSDFAAFWSGEFTRDVMAEESGKSAAFNDARYRKTSKGTNHRYEKNAAGQLEEVPVKANSKGYPYNEYRGLRNDNHVPFHKREDLMKYVLKKK